VHKEEPWNPSNDQQNQNCGVDPLKIRVVLIDDIPSDARSVDEAVGSREQSSLIESRIVVGEVRVGLSNGLIFGVPPWSGHGSNVEESREIS